jgi:eukaryotic-like serine/threonine-protein kinase
MELGREVALKMLPETFAADPQRLARFEREARLLAALNHPHVAAIHQVEDADGGRVLVLELVPGETLAERLRRGPLPLLEALPLFRQIAEGLEAAHDKGVLHRDLKPANIKITPDGKAKILDFGLAKAVAADEGGQDASHSPTISYEGTRHGVILGTAAYMSPEQARGKPVDKRTDIWSFGCVLFEALAGRRAFSGETISDTIAAILAREPEWSWLPAATPPRIRELLHRCLQKDVARRLHDVGDARIELDEAIAEHERGASASRALPAPGPARRSVLPWIALALVAGTLAGAVATRVGSGRRRRHRRRPSCASVYPCRSSKPLRSSPSLPMEASSRSPARMESCT